MIRFTASHFPLADLRRSSKTCVKRSDYRRRSRFAYVLADKERTEFQNEGSGEFQNETARLAKILKSRRNPGWGGRDRTSEWRNQNPLPYRLATPQLAVSGMAGVRPRNPFRQRRSIESGAAFQPGFACGYAGARPGPDA